MTLLAKLHQGKAKARSATIDRIIEAGAVAHKGDGSIIWRLSFAQTSVCGMIGRATMAPLYTKLHPGKYHPPLSLKEATAPRWWGVALARMKPRMETQKHPTTERIVYTDASGKSGIVAEVRSAPETFAASDAVDSVRASKTGHKWRKTFQRPATYMDVMS